MGIERIRDMKNKKFEAPELEIIYFVDEDIITSSGPGGLFGLNGDDWTDPITPSID